jgi:hypothetical protein
MAITRRPPPPPKRGVGKKTVPVDPTTPAVEVVPEVLPAAPKRDLLHYKGPDPDQVARNKKNMEEYLLLNKILKDLREGKTYYEVAAHLGMTAREAFDIVKKALEKYAPQFQENLETVKMLELQKLEVLEAAVWEEMGKGDAIGFDEAGNLIPPSKTGKSESIKTILAIQKARRDMLGLDAAKRMETTNTEIRRVYLGVDPDGI